MYCHEIKNFKIGRGCSLKATFLVSKRGTLTPAKRHKIQLFSLVSNCSPADPQQENSLFFGTYCLALGRPWEYHPEVMKQPFVPQHPKHCPYGHKHLSWSPRDSEISCWDCNRMYSLSDCNGDENFQPVQEIPAVKPKNRLRRALARLTT